MRRWFSDHGYLEVPTAVLVPSPALEEHLHAIPAGGGFLRTSPEFALKRAMACGLGRIYEIGPCFRDREHGAWHRREFTMCEWYRAGGEPEDVMDEVESLVRAAAAALGVREPGPWRRTTVATLFAEHAGLDLTLTTARDLSGEDESWDDAMMRRFVTDVEPALHGAVFVADWPASQAALARVRDDRAWPVATRFEAYIDGVELANAFHELLDAGELRARFEAANRARVDAGEAPHPVDERLIGAVGRMPRTTGIALGVDRLVAALMSWDGIGAGRVE
ncbi:MAG: EF-P lysine aminoacylase GenX [Alphaproteobacteria bacterium]|nr:EF-P lysine aminoacylase GenX [Alphaproteobacteria bacterium]MCB9696474.1 EF-P lysine aminoacylase GenX [Alphaproteobacteria bacterium]